ncbi:MAG: MerR family transcriptional regulator [Candidatus Dependentiae bacterium]|nr:MerR family transcriptional regulator [Candidatus Dependentiae bacterium]
MKMQKRKFRIGELAKILNVERFVIRFWEKEFILKATRSDGGQRFYDEKDLERFKQIKELLYEKGFTISGARKQLKSKTVPSANTSIIASHKTTFDNELSHVTAHESENLQDQITELQKQLMKLRELL